VHGLDAGRRGRSQRVRARVAARPVALALLVSSQLVTSAQRLL